MSTKQTKPSPRPRPRPRRTTVVERLALRAALIGGRDHVAALARSLGISPAAARLATAGFDHLVDLGPPEPSASTAGVFDDDRLRAATLAELGAPAELPEAAAGRLWDDLWLAVAALVVKDMAALEDGVVACRAELRAVGGDPTALEREFAALPKAADTARLLEAVAALA
jgi:hypothetical protein